jgi:cell division control protein 45
VPNDGDSEIDETESVEEALEQEEDGDGEGLVPDEESAEVEGNGEQLDGEAGSDEEGSGRKRKSTSAGAGAGSSPSDGRRRKRLRPMGGQDGESSRSESGSDGESEEGEEGGGRRAQRQSDLALMLQRQHLKARCEGVRRVRNYYSGNLWSVPAAFLAWRLCEELGRERKDMLWLACVGCTDLLLTERITAATYEMCAAVLRTRVRTLGGDTPKPLREDGKVATAGMYAHVAPSVEPRWVLHRSWSVRDAMTHSDYVSTRLGMHKEAAETGPAKVDRLLSQTGVPHRLLQGPFDLFPRAARERLFRRLHELVQEDEYGLGPEMFFPSFVRIVDKEVEVSAGDVAAVVAGLLSASGTTPALVALAEGRKSSNFAEAAGGPRGASPAPLSQREDAHEYVTSWRYNFNLAYDGLAQR